MPDISVQNFLEHSGVLGMHWGVRKSPEQVSKDRKAAYAKKAKKIQAKADIMSTKISELKAIKTDSNYKKRIIADDIADLTKEKNRLISDAEKKRNGKLTSTEKKLLIGAAVVGGIMLARGGKIHMESGAVRQLITKGGAFVKRNGGNILKRNEDLARAGMSADDILETVVKKANPGYGAFGTKMNCRRATMAFEMRRRGYDVVATRTSNASGQNAVGILNVLSPGKRARATSTSSVIRSVMKEQQNIVKKTGPTPISDLSKNFGAGARNPVENGYDVARRKGVKEYWEYADANKGNTNAYVNDIFDALHKQPNGSRGEIGVMWSMGGGHSMAYEVINNKAVIFDAQSGKKFVDAADFVKQITESLPKGAVVNTNDLIKQAGFTRLDDVPLNTDYLLRWIRNAG